MSEYSNKNRRNRNVSIPDFRQETERQYRYSNRPYQKDYLKGTEWDREEDKRKKEREERYQERRDRRAQEARDVRGQESKHARKGSYTERQKNLQKNRNRNRENQLFLQNEKERPYNRKNLENERNFEDKTVSQEKKEAQSLEKTGNILRAKKLKRKKIIYRVMYVSIFCVSILLGHMAGRYHSQFNQILNKRNTGGIDLQEVTIDESLLDSDSDITNILLVGADKRENWTESGRSDSTMVATIDRKHKRLKLTSLLRDMYIEIPNHGTNKFNASYSYGGIALLYQTIAYNFDLKLDGYIIVDFSAFKKVINKLGGVEIELTEAEANYLIQAYKTGVVTEVHVGMNKLNGAQALAYTRIRQDSAGDFGRTARQRKVLQSLFTKIKTKSLSDLSELAQEIMPYITTDLSNDEIFDYMKSVIMMGTTEIDQKRIPVDDSYTQDRINNMAVLIPNVEMNKQALQEFIFEYAGEEEENTES